MSSLIVEVCTIATVEPHPNADRLSVVTLVGKGWSCITGLNQYSVGDLVVFCPPDCIIPPELIAKYKLDYLKGKGRIRTVKLRGFISQGLLLDNTQGWRVGRNVAKELGITKWEPPISSNLQMSGRQPTKRKRNPLFDKYTDIENIKHYNEVFQPGDRVVITEKVHGSNFRAGCLRRHTGNWLGKLKAWMFGKHEFVYGSHNVQITGHKGRRCFYGEDVYGRIAKKYNLANVIPPDYQIFGEIYGNRIQDLTYGLKDIDVVFFDVKYKGKYVNWVVFEQFCLNRNLPIVPVLSIANYEPEMLDKYTHGLSPLAAKNGCPTQIREGCVIKTLEETNDRRIGRKILKSINPEYLLKKNRTEFH